MATGKTLLRSVFTVCASLLVLSNAGLAPAATVDNSAAASARSAIDAAYRQMNADFADNHVSGISDFLADDYSEVDPHGNELNEAESLKKLRDERSDILTITTQWEITDITPTDSGIEVEMKMHCFGTGQKRIAFFKVRGTFTNDMVVRDLWVDTPSGWRIKSRVKLLDTSHTAPG